jgi:hypothetical protein
VIFCIWMVDYIVLVRPGKRMPGASAAGSLRPRKWSHKHAWPDRHITLILGQLKGAGGINGDVNTPIISAPVDRHDVVLAGERLAVPAVPTLLQAQPGDPRHEVELGRPCVSGDDRIQAHARAGD